ncbi:MAG: hypothetical protein HEQ40_03920 [Lacibacter sp.]
MGSQQKPEYQQVFRLFAIPPLRFGATSIRQPFIIFTTIINRAIEPSSTIKFFAPLHPGGKNIFHSFIQTKALKFARRL